MYLTNNTLPWPVDDTHQTHSPYLSHKRASLKSTKSPLPVDDTSLNLDLSHLPTYLTNPALHTHALAKNTKISAFFGKNCFF